MKIGIPAEIKNHEYRVAITPAGVRTFVENHHEVIIKKNAGAHIGFSDQQYINAGAIITDDIAQVWLADMVLKVKEPQPSEYQFLRENLILFCFLHLAPDPIQTKQLIDNKVTAIAYETVTDINHRLPLLEPMSEIAGRISIQMGANALQLNNGGRGILLAGAPGVPPGKVVIIGGGAAGTEAARIALGMGATVTLIDINLQRLRHLDTLFGPSLHTLFSTTEAIENEISTADLVIGSVLIPGKLAPKLVTKKMLSRMQTGAVIVDISIDQGGCIETSKPTTHDQPTYIVDGIIHYCVTNMPGACARTSTIALTNATLHYALKLANNGLKNAFNSDRGFLAGLNTYQGHITNEHVAHDLGYPYTPPAALF